MSKLWEATAPRVRLLGLQIISVLQLVSVDCGGTLLRVSQSPATSSA